MNLIKYIACTAWITITKVFLVVTLIWAGSLIYYSYSENKRNKKS